MTTSPSLRPRSVAGVRASASRTAGTSKSSTLDGPDQSAATCCAKVVLPTCRAPSNATAGVSLKASDTAASNCERVIFCCISDYKNRIYNNK